MTIDQQIGSNIHTLLWARRMRQAQLCDVLGITRQSLHRKMRGEQPWSAKEVREAADALGVDPGALFELPAQRSPEVNRHYSRQLGRVSGMPVSPTPIRRLAA